MARRFLFASNETWAMAPDVARPTTSPPPRHASTFNPSLAVAESATIICFFLVGFGTGYFKRFILRPGESSDYPEIVARRPQRRVSRSTKPADVGLDPEVVSALPLVKFSEFVQTEVEDCADDCAVCLAVFVESDRLRLLPHCTHAFHAECIDEWFKAHSTCPLCRDSLKEMEAEDPYGQDHNAEGVAEQGGMRIAPADFDVVEVVIRGESSDAEATLSQGQLLVYGILVWA